MTVPPRSLGRASGLAAVVAGACYVLVGLFHPANVPASVTSTRWQVVHVLACVMCASGLFGMTGLYARQATRTGWMGLAGYLLLSTWLALVMGFSFVEAFVLPRVARPVPELVEAWMGMFNGPAGTFDLGVLPLLWTLTAPLYIGGGVLFGVATYRSGTLPRWAGLLLTASAGSAPVAVLLPNAWQPKTAIPFGMAMVWLGLGLASGARADQRLRSSSATHSTWWVIGKRSKARTAVSS